MKQIKTTFAGGEFSEALDGRVDLAKYPTGAQLLENFYVTRFGGTSNRQGTQYIDDALGSVQLVPFTFSVTQTYVLVFSELKMRILKDGGLVLTDRTATAGYKWTASAVSNEWYCELTAGGDPSIIGAALLEADSSAFDEGVVGSLAASEFGYGDGDTLGYSTIYMYSTTDPDSAFTAINTDYQVTSPYTFLQADSMTYAQSADTLFIAHKDIAPTSLTRTADDAWAFTTITFIPTIDAPGDITTSTTGFTTTDRDWFYGIAARNSDGEESVPSADQLVQGDDVWVSGDLVNIFWNNIRSSTYKWTASADGTNNFYLELAAGGDPSKALPASVYINLTEASEGTLGSLSSLEWAYGDSTGDALGYDTIYVRLGAGADPDTKDVGFILYKAIDEVEYPIYKNYRGDWGWIGTVQAPWYLDDNVEGLVAVGPKEFQNPFNAADDYPAAVGIFQQRLMFARTNNNPQTVWASQPGHYVNFGISSPLSADDSIEARLASGGSVDEIRHLVPLQKMLTLTEGSEWTFDHGQNSDALSPDNIEFNIQGYEGTSTVRPLTIGNEALFINRNERDIRSLRFKIEFASYVGNELTLLVPHLLDGKRIVSWCYQQHPDNIAWIILDDGSMLSFTYIPQQEVWAFARHNTDGLYKRCAAITTDGEDEVYFSVERTLNGTTALRLEQLHDRDLDHIYDAFFVDCGLSADVPKTISGVVVTASEITVTATAHGFSDGNFVHIDDVVGITADGTNTDYGTFNNKKYKVANKTANAFELEDIDGNTLTSADGFGGAWVRNGVTRKCFNSVSGLSHLEGESLSVCADGMSIGPLTVSSGSITLGTEDPGYAVVHVGLPYTCNVKTLRMDISGRNDGTIQGSKKTVKKCTFRFWKSSGGQAGPTADLLTTIKWRQDEDWDDANAMTSNDKDITVKSNWNKEGRVYFRQTEPLPTTILAIITYYEVGGR